MKAVTFFETPKTRTLRRTHIYALQYASEDTVAAHPDARASACDAFYCTGELMRLTVPASACVRASQI